MGATLSLLSEYMDKPMSKSRNVPAVTEAAKEASRHLSAWEAVEAHGKRILEAAKDEEISGDFAEVHFSKGEVAGVIKVGNVVLKIQG
jgi:hypothetical protein